MLEETQQFEANIPKFKWRDSGWWLTACGTIIAFTTIIIPSVAQYSTITRVGIAVISFFIAPIIIIAVIFFCRLISVLFRRLTLYDNLFGKYQTTSKQLNTAQRTILALKNQFQQRIKRILDILLSLLNIIVALPVMAAIAAVIKLTSKGPILYVHERLGLNERPFMLYKFRTMIDNAEEATGPVWAEKNDPRITPFGRFLRKTRLDELPQLFNVLRGDMSFVGPRPIRKFFAEKLAEEFPYYFLRFYVKPGLTGWAQVPF